MKTLRLRPASLAVFLVFSLGAPAISGAATPVWVEKSNAHTKILLEATGRFSPESASEIGLAEYDTQVVDLAPGLTERTEKALLAVRDELSRRHQAETDPLVRQDLEILLTSVNKDLDSNRLTDRLLLPYIDLGQLVFNGVQSLLDDQVAPARRPSAVTRLRRYTGLEPGSTSAFQLARDRYLEDATDPKRLGPFHEKVQQALVNGPRYVSGIRELFQQYQLAQQPGAPEALAAFEKQLTDYNAWLKSYVLPHARTDFRLPAELYADNLKNVGLDISPAELMQKALVAYTEIRNEMQAIAPLVAKEHGLAVTDYRAVMQALKKEQLPKAEVEAHYRAIVSRIEEIIRREHIISLPDRPMIMRLASDAESASQPAPHMQPPALVNNTGERGQFVLTSGVPPAADGAAGKAYDDFTHRAVAWTLTAHEGRPGHELQFTAMVERGVSQARSIFAFNSVNVEGWALYAEAEMKPYEPLDGQLFALQARLLRAARAFLDPMLNLGLMTRERAAEILRQEVGESEAMTQQEIDRYTFRAPGQATSYFYGYLKLMEIRSTTEVALGAKFNRHDFNDFLVNVGLLPPNLLAKAVREEFIPSQVALPAK